MHHILCDDCGSEIVEVSSDSFACKKCKRVKEVEELKRGVQIIYIPTHARGNINHPDCEEGFVVSIKGFGESAFCGFFRKGTNELRTVSNTELCDSDDLWLKDHHSQYLVNALIEKIMLELLDRSSKSV